jgi:heptaprenyl diphosphate synthase
VDEADVARLEACLRESVLGDDPFLNEVASHLIEAGGKRLRPALALTAASLGGTEVSRETLLGGVSVELVHLASLYHDDVMDEATRRRSVDSVNARWGNLVAIVAGDFLLARSAEIAASLGPEVAGLLAATLARLCQGQVAEVRAAFQIDRDEKDYLGAIANKTAALMSTACRVGALTAELDRTQVDDVTAFGEYFGMVFQIRDDVLDVIATEEELGKTPGQDLSEGIYTLPVQRALQDRVHGPRLRDLLGKPLTEHERDTARALVAASPGITAASDMAREFAQLASDAASRLGDNPVVGAFSSLSIRVATDLERTAGQERERFEALAG